MLITQLLLSFIGFLPSINIWLHVTYLLLIDSLISAKQREVFAAVCSQDSITGSWTSGNKQITQFSLQSDTHGLSVGFQSTSQSFMNTTGKKVQAPPSKSLSRIIVRCFTGRIPFLVFTTVSRYQSCQPLCFGLNDYTFWMLITPLCLSSPE